ncbi:RNA-binding RNA annealing protein [Leucoagaricus gongylophorus]
MDKSLEEIITSNRSSKRRVNSRRNTARAQLLGNGPATRARAAAAAIPAKLAATQAVPTSADKIIVSNLPADVNEAQIKELFTSTVGPTKEVNLSYDASGRSKGVAAVTFLKKGDANKAYSQYHNRLIDGKRPMKIEIVVDPSRPPPLSARVTPAAVTNGAQTKIAAATGRAGNPRRRRVRRGDRPPKSVADLDAEMEDYTAANAPTAVTTASA